MIEIRSSTVLPAHREDIELHTSDGQVLVGELASPINQARGLLITLHPLPTAGGFMDSHLLRKASNRLPALVDLAVLRFNTRGTKSVRGQSTGSFDGGGLEGLDVAAAVEFAKSRGFGKPWLVGWSFGTELAIKYGPDYDIAGAILLSPPLHRATQADLERWNEFGRPLVALVPELDDYLVPEAAMARFSVVKHAQVLGCDGEKHLWVGEKATLRVLNTICETVLPGSTPLPEVY